MPKSRSQHHKCKHGQAIIALTLGLSMASGAALAATALTPPPVPSGTLFASQGTAQTAGPASATPAPRAAVAVTPKPATPTAASTSAQVATVQVAARTSSPLTTAPVAAQPVKSTAGAPSAQPATRSAAPVAYQAAPSAPAPTAAPPPMGGRTNVSSYRLEIGNGKSQVLQVPAPYSDLMVADPKVADVVPLSDHSIYVVGKSLGATALTVYGPGKQLVAAVDVIVGPDIEDFKLRLHDILPEERDIAARASGQSLVLSGTVGSPVALQQALALAETYAPMKVVNMLGVEGTQQVMLSVRFVEMERTAANTLSVQMSNTAASGNPILNTTLGQVLTSSYGSASLGFMAAGGNMNLAIDGLETKGLVKTLAEPTLVAMSGDTASFLAGGEIPIPEAQTVSGSNATITVGFKQFGISLAFTPTIQRDGVINLVVKHEVSSLDPSSGVTEAGLVIPGLKVRRASTTIEMRDGESFTIAGLLSDNYKSNVNAFPFLGDVPVLGALFRSTGYQKDQTELVVVVTPHLVVAHRGPVATPIDHFVPPSDYELFLFGMASGKLQNLPPEDRALMSRDPTKGGVDGPYGHVVY